MLDETKWQTIGYVEDDGGDYDWQAVGLHRRLSDQTLWWSDEGGCSCNYAGYDLAEDEVEPLDASKYLARCHEVNRTSGHEQGIALLKTVWPPEAIPQEPAARA